MMFDIRCFAFIRKYSHRLFETLKMPAIVVYIYEHVKVTWSLFYGIMQQCFHVMVASLQQRRTASSVSIIWLLNHKQLVLWSRRNYKTHFVTKLLWLRKTSNCIAPHQESNRSKNHMRITSSWLNITARNSNNCNK